MTVEGFGPWPNGGGFYLPSNEGDLYPRCRSFFLFITYVPESSNTQRYKNKMEGRKQQRGQKYELRLSSYPLVTLKTLRLHIPATLTFVKDTVAKNYVLNSVAASLLFPL
jgi:hypothetical protein